MQSRPTDLSSLANALSNAELEQQVNKLNREVLPIMRFA
jgi:hypothetical protein